MKQAEMGWLLPTNKLNKEEEEEDEMGGVKMRWEEQGAERREQDRTAKRQMGGEV